MIVGEFLPRMIVDGFLPWMIVGGFLPRMIVDGFLSWMIVGGFLPRMIVDGFLPLTIVQVGGFLPPAILDIGNNSRSNTYSRFDVAIVHKFCKVSQHAEQSRP